MNESTNVIEPQKFNWEEYEKDYNSLVPNDNVEVEDKNTVVYSHDPNAQELFNKYINFSPNMPRKDLEMGEYIKVVDIVNTRETEITVELECGTTVKIDMRKEKKFIKLFDFDKPEEFVRSLRIEKNKKYFLDYNIHVYVLDTKPSIKVSLWEAYVKKQKEEFLKEIESPSKAYIAKIVEANKGGYFVEIQGVRAFMPGSLAAPNKIQNFNSLVGTNVTVMIEDYLRDMNSFIVSHKKYLKHIIPLEIKNLDLDKKYEGTITGTSKYGIFIEFNEIFTGLLHTSKMKPETYHSFKKGEFKQGDQFSFYINEITKDNRIILSEESQEEKKSRINQFIEDNKDKVLSAKLIAKISSGLLVKIDNVTGFVLNKDIQDKDSVNNGDIINVKFKEENKDKLLFTQIK
ncbi:MAG: S1 RNA-binding domain-containing protein [bacterium]